jgi:NADPH2:quinone reductase
MYAIRYHQYGDASVLSYEEVPLPIPKAGELRIKVTAVGLNFTEIYQRRGWYTGSAPFPLPIGGELSGVVDAIGDGVTDFQIGERVSTADATGAYAEYTIAPAAKVVQLPSYVSDEQAAALLLQGVTAQYLAYSTYPLKAGETALIHAAAGGVGLLLVQIAKKIGARVIATVSTEEKAALARGAGADEVILYSTEDFQAETMRLTNKAGVDVVYDSVGKTTFAKSLESLKVRGYMVLYGQASGPVEPIDPRILNPRGLYLTRPSRNVYTLTRAELLSRVAPLFDWVKDNTLSIRIDRIFPLKDAAAAQIYMEDRGTKGKVLLIP